MRRCVLRSASTTRACTSRTAWTASGDGDGCAGGGNPAPGDAGGRNPGGGEAAGGDAGGGVTARVSPTAASEPGVLLSFCPGIYAAHDAYAGSAVCAPTSGD